MKKRKETKLKKWWCKHIKWSDVWGWEYHSEEIALTFNIPDSWARCPENKCKEERPLEKSKKNPRTS